MTTTDAEDENVTPLRRLEPGDVLDVVQKLRKFMVSTATTAFTLYASFEEFGDPQLEEQAQVVRRTLELATSRVASLVKRLEETPAYVGMLEQVKAHRKERNDD